VKQMMHITYAVVLVSLHNTNKATARNFEVISNQFDELSGTVEAVGPGFSAM
jgi:hypothetical protein